MYYNNYGQQNDMPSCLPVNCADKLTDEQKQRILKNITDENRVIFSVNFMDGFSSDGRRCGGTISDLLDLKQSVIVKIISSYGEGVDGSEDLLSCYFIPEWVRTQDELIDFVASINSDWQKLLKEYINKTECISL